MSARFPSMHCAGPSGVHSFRVSDGQCVLCDAVEHTIVATPEPAECRRCGADITLTDGQWVDVNGGPDGDSITCSQAPRPNYGPHIPLAN